MKNNTILILCGILMSFFSFSQEDTTIEKIKKDFQNWDTFFNKSEELDYTILHNYSWGKNYAHNAWYSEEREVDSLTRSKVVSIYENKELGYYIQLEKFSFSGDWFVISDHYFNPNGQLYFIYWRLSTFYAEVPATIERRLYFNEEGELIKNLESMYKMQTDEEINVSYMERKVEYKTNLKELDFYNYWKESSFPNDPK